MGLEAVDDCGFLAGDYLGEVSLHTGRVVTLVDGVFSSGESVLHFDYKPCLAQILQANHIKISTNSPLSPNDNRLPYNQIANNNFFIHSYMFLIMVRIILVYNFQRIE